MRVLHAPITALYQPSLMVRALREIGVEADLMLHHAGHQDYRFDLDDQIILGTGDLASVTIDFFLQALDRYDVVHLHSGYSLLCQSRKGKEFGFLARAGKLVVLSRWGCSDGHPPSHWFARRGLCDICPVPRNACNDALAAARLEREDRHADIIINHEMDHNGFNHRAVFMHGLIDLDFWSPDLEIPTDRLAPRAPGALRVLHAVGGGNRGDVKGSSAVRAATEALSAQGLLLEYDEVTGIPFHELRWRILQADIVVDQLRYGSFGSFAREALALGKPVLGHVIEEQRRQLPGLPIVETTPQSIAEALGRLAADPAERERLGREGREYACANFSHKQGAAFLAELYRAGIQEKRHGLA